MKSINEYINEELKKYPIWCDIVMQMFTSVKNITKDAISDMIKTFCDVEGRLKKFSDYLADKNSKDYLAYQPNDDEFLNKDNIDKITGQISEYILKFVVK